MKLAGKCKPAVNLKKLTIMKKNQHVMYEDSKWIVKGEGDARPHGSYKTQKEAIEAGREISRRQKSELLVHKKEGNAIRMKNSYGNDPKGIKG